MQRLRALTVVLLCALAVAAPAAALPRVNPATRHQLSALMDRFVRDVVLRRDLAEGWTLVAPDMRRGTTRAAWIAGRGVTAEHFAAIGRHFGNEWYATYVTRSEIALTLTLRTGRGNKAEMIDAQVVVVRHGRGWLVKEFYPAAIIRLGSGHRGSCATAECAISGPNDFNAGAPPSGAVGGASTIASHWIWFVLGGIAGLPVATIAGIWLYGRRRNRQAMAAYLATRRP
jgi:hypothetical protein